MADRQIIYDTKSGKIVARESLTCSFGGLGDNRAVIIADIPDTVTHVTTQTIPPGQRKKAVRRKGASGITSDAVADVGDLIEKVANKDVKAALRALRALMVEELPSE